jgi:hypothetical protein
VTISFSQTLLQGVSLSLATINGVLQQRTPTHQYFSNGIKHFMITMSDMVFPFASTQRREGTVERLAAKASFQRENNQILTPVKLFR